MLSPVKSYHSRSANRSMHDVA